jgi:hypothetical protein
MPSIGSSTTLQMSALTWGEACKRVAGSISGASQPDALSAARDAIQETLQDWDSRRDWRYTQVVAPDISIAVNDSTFALPTTFKKPYVAYLTTAKKPLWYIERANWHRIYPGSTATSIPDYYSIYNEATTAVGNLFPTASAVDTLVVLYYKAIDYIGADTEFVDIPDRWAGYILAGARMRLIASKVASDKAVFWLNQYEAGVKKAKEDDQRIPDQFLSFEPPDSMAMPPYHNPNSTRAAQFGTFGWGG